jgi:IS1 family transposase
MNRLSTERRGQIISLMVEGMSMRAISRATGAARNTIDKLLVDLGEACSAYMDVTLRNLDCDRIEADEIWAFCYSKQKNVPEEFQGTYGYGDVWTWTALDADTKLMVSFLVGERTIEDCYTFLSDLRSRLLPGQRIQLTTDGLGIYPRVVDSLWRDGIDYAQVIKEYGQADTDHRYSPAVCTSIEKRVLNGDPVAKHISTSYVERQNLTMRMGMRRFTRLTNGFSKKVENHAHAVSLHFFHYNFCRPHQTLSKAAGKPTTPAMAAGVETFPWSVTQLAELLD